MTQEGRAEERKGTRKAEIVQGKQTNKQTTYATAFLLFNTSRPHVWQGTC